MLSLAISKLDIRLENDRRGYFEGEVGLFNLGEDPIKCDQGSLVLNIIYRDGQKLTANPILSGLEGKFPLMKGQSAVVPFRVGIDAAPGTFKKFPFRLEIEGPEGAKALTGERAHTVIA